MGLRFISDVTKLNSCSFCYGEGGGVKVSHLSHFEFTAHKIIFFKININIFMNLVQKDYYFSVTQDT